jgi:hypothetical protein
LASSVAVVDFSFRAKVACRSTNEKIVLTTGD